MSDLVTLTIDSLQVSVPKGTLIVEAARKLGIEIPVYCYHPKMAPVGACRVCVVDVEKQRRPIMPACATEVMEGMVVHTRNKAATAAREGVLELLLINHPLDCPVCDRGGECDLQDFTLRYGPPRTRFTEEKRHFQKSIPIGREVVLDRERCIMCMRCVRFCSEVAVEQGLTIIERGVKSEVGPFPGTSFDSQFSGNTVEICPVGALTSKTYRFRSRPWELQNFASVCNRCSMGCNITVDVRYDAVVRFRSRVNDHIDDGWLCDAGRYGFGDLNTEDRLLTPMVRKNGGLVATTWEEALKAAAEGLKKFSPSDVGVVAGPKISNEAGWLLTRLARATLGTGNLDHRRGKAFTTENKALPLSAKIEGCDHATAFILVDCDPSKTTPVLDLRIKKGLRKGAALINIGANGLSDHADVQLDSLEQLTKALSVDVAPPHEAIKHPHPRPWESGGKTSTDGKLAAELAKKSANVVVIFDENHTTEGVAELAESLGCLGQAPYGLLMLVAGANSTGLREMGVLPVVGPGWQALGEAESAYKTAWGTFSTAVGKDYHAMTNGGVKAMLAMGEDRIEGRPEFLVVADIRMSDLAKQADVVLPACTYVEQSMTMTNLDGTVQLCRQALPSKGESLPDWQIVRLLSQALGQEISLDGSAKIFGEIGRLNPSYKNASYADFQTDAAVHWSYPQQGKLGTPRPDLSGMPNHRPDAAPWVPSEPTGSKVERAARLNRGDVVPEVPGQDDPRLMAARMSLASALESSPHPIPEGAASRVGGGELEGGRRSPPLRQVLATGGPQPPGPSPAQRYHHIGQQPRETQAPPPPAPAPEEEVAQP